MVRRTPAPRRVNADPPWLQNHPPEHAQGVFREAFDRAFAARACDPRQEAAAHRVALARSRERLGVHSERAGGPDEAFLSVFAASEPIFREAIVG